MTRARAPAGALLVAGCAALLSPGARRAELERQLDSWSSAASLDVAWQEARLLLAGRGYPLAGKDATAAGQPPMPIAERLLSPARETALGGPLERTLDTGWTRARDRYRVASRPTAAGWRVVFLHVDEGSGDRPAVPARDVELELALVRRVDPAGAARIDAALAAPGSTRR